MREKDVPGDVNHHHYEKPDDQSFKIFIKSNALVKAQEERSG
jgi:hypothetical protein